MPAYMVLHGTDVTGKNGRELSGLLLQILCNSSAYRLHCYDIVENERIKALQMQGFYAIMKKS